MINTELQAQERRIKSLIHETEQLSPDNEQKVHLTKYICILVSGFMENAVYHVFGDYSRTKLEKQAILNYIDEQLTKVNNPNSNQLRRIVKAFKVSWESDLKAYMQDNNRAGALNSVMRERHKIAHGKNSDITLTRMKDYFIRCTEIVDFIEQQCLSCEE